MATEEPVNTSNDIPDKTGDNEYKFIGLYAARARRIANGLGQGNLWLFNDIAPAHWLYSNYPEHFFNGMDYLSKCDASQLEEHVK